MVQDFITANDVQHKVTLLPSDIGDISVDQLVSPVTMVFSEPFFTTSLLPWHSLYFWYLRNNCRHLLADGVISVPAAMTIWGLPVQFRDLWKIRAPLHQCNGFKMDIFDNMIETACEKADDKVEPQPLWEYPSKAKGHPIQLLKLDLTKSIPDSPVHAKGLVTLPEAGIINGLALWVDWHMTAESEDILTTGPVEPIVLNQNVSWDVYTRQGIYLLKQPVNVNNSQTHQLSYSTIFQPSDGSVKFDFQVKA